MSRVIGRRPTKSNRSVKEMLEDESDDENVFADETIFPCYHLYKIKNPRPSVSGNSAKLESINLNDSKEKLVPPIRKIGVRSIEDPFRKFKVPDEVIDVILSTLRKRDLLSAMLVNKKFYSIGHQSKRWMITDATERPVSELSLITLMKRKIRVLRLAGAMPDLTSRVNVRMFASCMLSVSRLEFLDLSRANFTERQLLILLKPCRKLQCLSIEGSILSDQVATCISDNKQLRELDISMTRGLNIDSAKLIFESCRNLEQLNASWCGLSRDVMHAIFETITDKIRKLNISGSIRGRGLNDELIDMLSAKANHMTDLDLSDNGELCDAAVATIMSSFPKLSCLSLNRCYGVDPNMIVHFNSKSSLRFLNVHGCITDYNMELFLQMCDRLKINSHFFNFIAKPVATNSQSIWGFSMLEK